MGRGRLREALERMVAKPNRVATEAASAEWLASRGRCPSALAKKLMARALERRPAADSTGRAGKRRFEGELRAGGVAGHLATSSAANADL